MVASVPTQYVNQIQYVSGLTGVPASLLAAQIEQESGFNPDAVSSAGAIGISQFMPSTAATLGINPNDPNESILGQGYYMAGLYAHFGSWPLALAGYNAGAGAVEAAGNAIPQNSQTVGYVKNVLAMQPNYAWLDAPIASSSSPYESAGTASMNDSPDTPTSGLSLSSIAGAAADLLTNGEYTATITAVDNVRNSLGAFIVGIALVTLGVGLFVFSFGEDIARALAPVAEAVVGDAVKGGV